MANSLTAAQTQTIAELRARVVIRYSRSGTVAAVAAKGAGAYEYLIASDGAVIGRKLTTVPRLIAIAHEQTAELVAAADDPRGISDGLRA